VDSAGLCVGHAVASAGLNSGAGASSAGQGKGSAVASAEQYEAHAAASAGSCGAAAGEAEDEADGEDLNEAPWPDQTRYPHRPHRLKEGVPDKRHAGRVCRQMKPFKGSICW
jgi:hypothetical protein